MFQQRFKQDFRAVTERLRDGPPFALARFNDGELAILKKEPYRAASGWVTKGDTWIRTRLMAALQCTEPDYYIGISPICCIPKGPAWYSKNVRTHRSSLTFATLFFNANYHQAKAYFSQLDALKVGCAKACDLRVPRDAVNKRWDVDAVVAQMLESKRPILLAAGPAACVLAHRYWLRAPPGERQSVIDVGAILDVELHGQPTRDYQKRDAGSQRILRHACTWTMTGDGRHPVSHEPLTTNSRPVPAGFNVSTGVSPASAMTAAAVNQRDGSRVSGTPHADRGAPPKPTLPSRGWLRKKR